MTFLPHPERLGVTLLVFMALACGKDADSKGLPPTEPPAGKAPARVEEPPAPPPKRLFAKKFVVKVRSAPNRESEQLGYVRAGAVFRAKTAEPVGHDRCRAGWFELETGGFVCNVADVIAFEGDRLPEWRATQADLSAKLPYPFGYAKANRIPVFRRLPSAEDWEELRVGRDNPVDQDGGAEDAGTPTLESLAGDGEGALLRYLMKGFYVSLDRELEGEGRSYWRTQHNEYIPAESLGLVGGSDFAGFEIGEGELALPVGYTLSSRTRAYGKDPRGRMRPTDPPGYHHRFPLRETETVGGVEYYGDGQGQWFRARDITRIDPRSRPKKIPEGVQWIDVDLGHQTLVAYEGDRPVFATLVSTGRVKSRNIEALNHETPLGVFQVRSKHLTHVMDGDNAIDGPYSIEDVPYVMYFEGAYAFHAAFWHNRFGRTKSHGCVNMSPQDAKWLFQWAAPPLPKGWHAIYPTENEPAPWVYIHGETPLL
ncbi:MAG: L,D-transpeptidase [Myxococcales bacterium]|nr:L,D-transpeptidase [Myxococcales bacterium]